MDCFVVKVARSATEDHISLGFAWDELADAETPWQPELNGATDISRFDDMGDEQEYQVMRYDSRGQNHDLLWEREFGGVAVQQHKGFEAGDLVSVHDSEGIEIAQGLSRIDHSYLQQLIDKGKTSAEVVIHCDELVLL